LVAIFNARAINPDTIYRGFTKQPHNTYRPIKADGWLLTRNAYELFNHAHDQFETVTKQLIVTRGNHVLSKDYPYLADSDSIEIPSFKQFDGAEYLYKYEFVTSAIIMSVHDQLARHGIASAEA